MPLRPHSQEQPLGGCCFTGKNHLKHLPNHENLKQTGNPSLCVDVGVDVGIGVQNSGRVFVA